MRSTWGALIGLASIVIAPILPAVAQDAASPMAVTSQAVPASPAAVNYNGTDTYTGTIGIGQGGYLYFRKDINNGVGYRQGFSTIGGFQPLMLTPNGGLFGQGQMFITDDGQVGGNLGGGARYFAEEANRVFGAYGFFDFDDTQSGFSNQQIGIGFETLGPMWDFRANGYFPLNTDQHFVRLNSVSSTPFFSGNTALFTGQALFQKTMVGGDAEIGIPLFDPSAFGRLRVYFGGYGYDGAKKDQIGARARIEDHINEYVTIGAAFMHDDVNGDMVTMAVDIRGWSRVLPNLNNRDISNRAKMFLPVVRQYRIATERFQSSITAAALGPMARCRMSCGWTIPTAAGDGTFENPFHNLLPSRGGSGLHPGAEWCQLAGEPALGGITLANNQIMCTAKASTSTSSSMGTALAPARGELCDHLAGARLEHDRRASIPQQSERQQITWPTITRWPDLQHRGFVRERYQRERNQQFYTVAFDSRQHERQLETVAGALTRSMRAASARSRMRRC
ncbi:MAG: inverse autotransporter beta domain-containing protein [Planctomycetaceae bacterium]